MSKYQTEFDTLLDDLDGEIYELRKFISKLDRSDEHFTIGDQDLLRKAVVTLAALDSITSLAR